MRKIEHLLLLAIWAKKPFQSDNTSYNPETGDVHLHGNRIAIVDTGKVPPKISFTLAGFNTPTTRSRINAILKSFNIDGRVSQRGYQPYFRDSQIDSKEWIVVGHGEVPK